MSGRFRICKKCGQQKPVEDFREEGVTMGRFFDNCRDCGGSVIPKPPVKKVCRFCGEEKPAVDFKAPGADKGRLADTCNACKELPEYKLEEALKRRAREHRYRKANREKINKAALKSVRKKREKNNGDNK